MFEDEPAPKPCGRHVLVGREYDPGCYSCQRDHAAAVESWKKRTLEALAVVTFESMFVEARW